MGFQTDCTTTGEDRERYLGAVAPPIYEASLFTFPTYEAFVESYDPALEGVDERWVYSRFGNPTVQVLERKVALLEGGDQARAFASGMAAISAAVLSACRAGDHVVAVRSIYANAYRLLAEYLPPRGIDTTFVDFTDLNEVEAAIGPRTRVLYMESPGNPTMDLVDLRAAAQLARSRELTTIMDNSMASPYNQRPLEMGVDVVVHSASKYFSGHSDVVAGVMIGSDDRMRSISATELRDLGGALAPFEAWLVLRGLRTLGIRMRSHNEAGLRVATWLESRPEVERVFYAGLPSHPQHELAKSQMSGFSGLMSLVVRGGKEAAITFVNRLKLFGIGVSWGGFESLALPIDPTTSAHPTIAKSLGVVPGFVRMSIGLEDVEDLLCDLDQGLTAL